MAAGADAMISFYPDIKQVHIAAALTSGALFGLRGAAILAGMRWPRYAPVRYLSYTVDTVLLTAAMMLLTVLPAGLFANGWLIVKIGFVLAYVVLGVLAFRPHRRGAVRVALLLAALLSYLQIYCIARSHHPLGAFYLLSG